MLIRQATVITIVNYIRNKFKVQATGVLVTELVFVVTDSESK
jgi:hypothetical protein